MQHACQNREVDFAHRLRALALLQALVQHRRRPQKPRPPHRPSGGACRCGRPATGRPPLHWRRTQRRRWPPAERLPRAHRAAAAH